MSDGASEARIEGRILQDPDLIDRARLGDPRAREQLAIACLPRVRRLVHFSCADKGELDDVVQVAMVTIFRDLPAIRHTDRFLGWVDTVVYNVVRTHGRRRSRLLSIFTSSAEAAEPVAQRTPEDEGCSARLFLRLLGHLEHIGHKKRTAVVMVLFFGYVDQEVAELMGCSVETAKKRVQHGRKELVDRLRRDPDCVELLKEVCP